MLVAAFQFFFTMVDTQDSSSFCILFRKGLCISGSQFLLLCFVQLRWWCYLLIIDALFRYEDLKQQLLSAQNLAEQEGDQEQLARAAAAVARLTFPSSGVVDTSARPSAMVLHAPPLSLLCAPALAMMHIGCYFLLPQAGIHVCLAEQKHIQAQAIVVGACSL